MNYCANLQLKQIILPFSISLSQRCKDRTRKWTCTALLCMATADESETKKCIEICTIHSVLYTAELPTCEN